MRDFTLPTFKLLLSTLKSHHYTFQTFADFLKNPQPRAIILRHDVDDRKLNSLRTARIENEMGIVGTYNFRMVPQSYDEAVIREISGMGHEIGYHYEELALMKGNFEKAIKLFEKNLSYLRQVTSIETICMHGSPLSKYDNRKLWQKYNYHDFGIIGEPYFDLDFSKMLYLTDTGRRWDGGRVSVRDKILEKQSKSNNVDVNRTTISSVYGRLDNILHSMPQKEKVYSYQSTYDIISYATKGIFSNIAMINIHPQRWENTFYLWVKELVMQKVKNWIKGIIVELN